MYIYIYIYIYVGTDTKTVNKKPMPKLRWPGGLLRSRNLLEGTFETAKASGHHPLWVVPVSIVAINNSY